MGASCVSLTARPPGPTATWVPQAALPAPGPPRTGLGSCSRHAQAAAAGEGGSGFKPSTQARAPPPATRTGLGEPGAGGERGAAPSLERPALPGSPKTRRAGQSCPSRGAPVVGVWPLPTSGASACGWGVAASPDVIVTGQEVASPASLPLLRPASGSPNRGDLLAAPDPTAGSSGRQGGAGRGQSWAKEGEPHALAGGWAGRRSRPGVGSSAGYDATRSVSVAETLNRRPPLSASALGKGRGDTLPSAAGEGGGEPDPQRGSESGSPRPGAASWRDPHPRHPHRAPTPAPQDPASSTASLPPQPLSRPEGPLGASRPQCLEQTSLHRMLFRKLRSLL